MSSNIIMTNIALPDPDINLYPCYVYMRCSSFGQMDGDTWDRQSFACESFVADHQMKVVRVYRDEGVSGTRELVNRPGLSRMLDDLTEKDEARAVIVEKLDRLARDVIVQENIIRLFENRQIKLYSASPAEQDLCSNDPTRKFIRVILGASAQLEKDLIVFRTRAARERMRANGERCEGRKPYGETDKERHILQRMREMRKQKLAYMAIAERLNYECVPTRSGGKWVGATVRKILTREA